MQTHNRTSETCLTNLPIPSSMTSPLPPGVTAEQVAFAKEMAASMTAAGSKSNRRSRSQKNLSQPRSSQPAVPLSNIQNISNPVARHQTARTKSKHNNSSSAAIVVTQSLRKMELSAARQHNNMSTSPQKPIKDHSGTPESIQECKSMGNPAPASQARVLAMSSAYNVIEKTGEGLAKSIWALKTEAPSQLAIQHSQTSSMISFTDIQLSKRADSV